MKYVVITTKGSFDFTLGKLGLTPGKIACVDEDGTIQAHNGTDIVALMRTDFAEEYEAAMDELKRLRSPNGVKHG